MITLDWKKGRAFEVIPPSGIRFTLDAYPESGGQDLGPTPMEALLASLAACSAMDVINILEKKRLPVTGYRLEVDGERGPEGIYPRPYTSITLRHVVEGDGIDPGAVEQAVRLSDEKYCSVAATLRFGPEIRTEVRVELPAAA